MSSLLTNDVLVVMEDVQIWNMSRSAAGTVEEPGGNVGAKRGLNKAIQVQGWFEFRQQLTYKQAWCGGLLILVPPQYTSQACSSCGYVGRNNRTSQAVCKSIACGFEANADDNIALNILAAGPASQPVVRFGLERPR